MLAASQCDLRNSTVDLHDPALGRYLMASMGSLGEEVLRVLFLDGCERLIADEQMQWGGLAQVALHPRTIFRRAMELEAAGIIIVHNHPSGDARPSESDIEITELLRSIGQPLEIVIIGHIVVTSSSWQHVPISPKIPTRKYVDAGLQLKDVAADLATIEQTAFANALRTIRRRELRRSLIGSPEFFGEPAWDMLVDLFVHDCAGKPVSTSSLCIASGVPPTTALRLLHRLCDAGIMLRRRDAYDGRVQLIELTSSVRRKLLAYFAAVTIEEK
jgi:DNA repair protein RadC